MQASIILELGARFIIGGLVVSAFAVIGDILRPKTFAGIFGGSPSVALATLGLTFAAHGGSYAGIEGRSMLAGALALVVYSLVVGEAIFHWKGSSLVTAATGWLAWAAVGFGLWGLVLR